MTRAAFLDDAVDPVERLFEIADPVADPEGLITKFLAFESFRMHRERRELEMIGSVQERLSVLLWYLSDYVRDRRCSVQVPLSARQIAFLNAPMPLAGASPAVTVALFNFVTRERPDLAELHRDDILREALYWWCAEKTPTAKLFDTLVTEDQIAVLSQDEQWFGEDYPLNAFMTRYFRSHVDLHGLDMNAARDRAAYFHYLVLLAFTQPYVARFLPPDLVRKTLKAQLDGGSAFDKVLAKFALGDAPDHEGATLRAQGEALVRRAGFNLLRAGARRIPAVDSGECLVAPPPPSSTPERGVALIGPLRKASGLGQATRLSYESLSRITTYPAPTALPFDLDNPAPIGFSSDQTVKPYRAPRSVNLIHLNAESLPLAVAYLPRAIFATSYNIGFFFWELDAIPKCHRLALEMVDEIWVASDYNREIYSRETTKPVVNVGMAVETPRPGRPADRADFGLDPEAFVFLSTFDSFSFIERKNPLATLEAFRAAFPLGTEKVQLLLKTQNRGRVHDPYQIALWKRIDRAIAADPRIVLVNDTLAYADLLALKRACDAYVSLHRSEGWGFGMIEAMQIGLPVIATAYSGNLEFCNDDTAFLVEFDLTGVREEEYIFVERGSRWAKPRVASAAAQMRTVALSRDQSRAKARAAQVFVAERFSPSAIARRYAARLAEIISAR